MICPRTDCESELRSSLILQRTSLEGLPNYLKKKVRKGKAKMRQCTGCGYFFMVFNNDTIYYYRGDWRFLKVISTKEKVVFT